MSADQSAGEVMAFGIIDQANTLAKSARMTQQALELQIEELVAMEEGVKAEVSRLQAAIKSLDAERAKLEATRKNLEAVSPTLQQNAIWAVQGALNKQGEYIATEIRSEVREAIAEPILEIRQAATHVRQNVRESKWQTAALFVCSGIVIGALAGYLPLHAGQNRLESNVSNISSYLERQQEKANPAVVAPPVQPSGKKGKR